ncbi:MAG TPA: hypothetical protein VG847_15250 [Chitinophagaceae bacterium]|nr:hypothetical protein [Chitinophagaceae bacterium]
MTSKNSTPLLKPILIAGLLAGTLDAIAAILDYYIATGKNPVIVFIFIASGIFGNGAFSMSRHIAWLGLFLHFSIAVVFSAFYFLIFPKIKLLQKSRAGSAIMYGIFAWAAMNLIVVPLSNTPPLPFHAFKAIKAALILILCIGTPVCFLAASFYKKKEIAK